MAGRVTRRGALLAGVALPLVAALGVWLAGAWLSAPKHREVGEPPPGFEAITFAASDQRRVSAWAHDDGIGPLVLLAHAWGVDRRTMVERAEALVARGYDVLLFDLHGHGESEGDRITFGHRESHTVEGAVAWARRHEHSRRLGAIGVSLGGASLLLAQRTELDAIVVEAVFPTLDDAVTTRLQAFTGPLAPLLRPLLLSQVALRTEVTADDLRPIDRIGDLPGAILVVGGTEDPRTPEASTRALFEAAEEPRALWMVPGAGHENFHAFAPEAYAQHVFGFLEEHLPLAAWDPLGAVVLEIDDFKLREYRVLRTAPSGSTDVLVRLPGRRRPDAPDQNAWLHDRGGAAPPTDFAVDARHGIVWERVGHDVFAWLSRSLDLEVLPASPPASCWPATTPGVAREGDLRIVATADDGSFRVVDTQPGERGPHYQRQTLPDGALHRWPRETYYTSARVEPLAPLACREP